MYILEMNLHHSMPVMRAHGVPEISLYLDKKIVLEECINKGQQATRNYVKRQVTWWKSSKFYNCRIFNHFPSNIELESFHALLINPKLENIFQYKKFLFHIV